MAHGASGRRPGWLVPAASVAVYLCAGLASAHFWEPAHDEGITWHQSIGALRVPRWPAEPAPVATLYESVGRPAEHGTGDVVDTLMIQGGMHPPAYYLLVNRWSALVGTGRIALVLPFLVLGVLGLFAMRELASRLVAAPGAGDAAMALLALSPWFVGFSTLARPYAASLCLTIVSLVLWLRVLDEPGRTRHAVSFGLVSLLGIYTLYHHAFVAAAQLGLWALFAWRLEPAARRQSLRSLAAATAILVLGFAPWLPRLLVHLEATAGDQHYFGGLLSPGEWPGRTRRLLVFLMLGEARSGPGALRTALYALGLLSLPLVARSLRPSALRSLPRPERFAWLFAPVALAGVVAADLWHGTHTLFVSKTSFWLLPVLILLVVRGWSSAPSIALGRAGLLAWAALLGTSLAVGIDARAERATPYEVIASYLRRMDFESHHVAISSGTAGYAIPFLLTLRDAGVEGIRIVKVPRARLLEYVESVTSDPAIRTVSLVNLAVSYRPEDVWTQRVLTDVREHARSAGWRDHLVRPGSPKVAARVRSERWRRQLPPPGAQPPDEPERERLLTIFSLTKVSYFSQ